MTELKNLLERALTGGPAAGLPVDPAADLDRGRDRLRRRRHTVVTGVAAAVVAAAVVPVALTAGAPARPPQAVPAPAASRSVTGTEAASGGPDRALAIELVAYSGAQVPGYRVAEVPQGWRIQGGDAYVLTIAPEGTEDRHYASFVGKLVVMLGSSTEVPSTGTSQPVDGRPGRFEVQEETQVLTYQDADGRWLIIQAPTSLGWDGRRLARFAGGVEVLGNAKAANG